MIIDTARMLEELYIENLSVWEEVFSGDLSPEDALDYMKVDGGSELWKQAYEHLTSSTTPL